MADTNGRTDTYLNELLGREPFRFDFFQAVCLLERLSPQGVAVGHDGPPGREAVRFRGTTSLAFAPSAIASLEQRAEGPPLMTTTFLGLYGRHGTLPWHYTTRIRTEERAGNSALRAFLDIFNHRLLSLFFRAGVKNRLPLRYRTEGGDGMVRNLLAFPGLATRGLHDHLPFPDTALLRYAGLFLQPRSAGILSTMLEDFTGVPVTIEQFRGEWLEIDPDERNRIGAGGTGNRPGISFTIGRRIQCRHHRFRVHAGPVNLRDFATLVPGAKRFQHLTALTRLYAGPRFTFDVKVTIRRTSVPGMVLGKRSGRIGHTVWLATAQVSEDMLVAPVFCPDAPAAGQSPEECGVI